jgi:predicted amidophosphoribosyltransferase
VQPAPNGSGRGLPHSPDDALEAIIASRRRERSEKAGGFCPKCGRPVQKSDYFCPRCGAKTGVREA